MRKATNHNKEKEKPTKKGGYKYFDEYHPLFSFRKTPIPEAFIDNLIEQMGEYYRELLDDLRKDGKKKFSYTVEEFYDSRMIPETTQGKWRKRYPRLQEAHEQLILMLGRLRLAGAIHGDFKESTIHHDQWHYSPLWRESEERKDERNAKIKDNVATTLVAGLQSLQDMKQQDK